MNYYDQYGLQNKANTLWGQSNDNQDYAQKTNNMFGYTENNTQDTAQNTSQNNQTNLFKFPTINDKYGILTGSMSSAPIQSASTATSTSNPFNVKNMLQDRMNMNAQMATNKSANYSDNSQADYSKANSSNLGDMDIKNNLPKLSQQQISAIIQKHFSQSNAVNAQDVYNAQQKTGMSALAILGIGALESGWGTSSIAKEKGNLWGYGADNANPGTDAHDYSSGGATKFASEFMKDYYNGYGAKSINSAGTGDNPSGMGYAYNDDGSISTTWANDIDGIMGKLYDTAKAAGNFDSGATANTANTSTTANTSDTQSTYNPQYADFNVQSPMTQSFNNIQTAAAQNGKFAITPTSTSNQMLQFNNPNVQTFGNSSAGAASNLQQKVLSGIVSTAKKYIGTPYVYGGETPDGFDCSGYAQYVYAQNGKDIPRTSEEQFQGGTPIDKANLQPGDLVFFVGSDGSQSAPGHVGIYAGNGQYYQAPKTGDVVKVSSLDNRSDYVGARRY